MTYNPQPTYKNTVKNGELSEQIFSKRCFVDHGYMVSSPIGTADYDFVVDVREKLYKVQVKSSRTGQGNVMICKGSNGQKNTGRGKYPYPENSIDFFAIHDVVPDQWYIIPRKKTGDFIHLRLAYKKSVGKYSKYKDNWEFKEEGPLTPLEQELEL
jgi:hypothetical protein|tara:strand:- start:367 stop:834 length:468 start_codon:yes stop_codon:yes gene_type:complete